MTQFLVLFDVDGTLLLTHDELYVEASRASLKDVYGIVPDAADTPGDTATANARRALRTAGCSDDEIDSRLAEWCAAFSRRYVDLLRTADTNRARRRRTGGCRDHRPIRGVRAFRRRRNRRAANGTAGRAHLAVTTFEPRRRCR